MSSHEEIVRKTVSLARKRSWRWTPVLYQARGYRFVEYCQWEVTNYRSMIFAKRLG